MKYVWISRGSIKITGKILSGSSSTRCITTVMAVGGLTSDLTFVSISNSIVVIWASLTFPFPNHATNVDNMIQLDSLTLIEMCNVAMETSLRHILVAINLSNRDMLSATTSRDKLKESATLYSWKKRRRGANKGKYRWIDGASLSPEKYVPT